MKLAWLSSPSYASAAIPVSANESQAVLTQSTHCVMRIQPKAGAQAPVFNPKLKYGSRRWLRAMAREAHGYDCFKDALAGNPGRGGGQCGSPKVSQFGPKPGCVPRRFSSWRSAGKKGNPKVPPSPPCKLKCSNRPVGLTDSVFILFIGRPQSGFSCGVSRGC